MELMSIAPKTQNIIEFTDYILDTYISEEAIFPPYLWARKPGNDPNTTNGAESFHAHYNSQFYSSHPNLFQVINVLQQIQVETNTKCNALNKNIYNIRRKVILEKQEYLKTCWDKYISGEIKLVEYTTYGSKIPRKKN